MSYPKARYPLKKLEIRMYIHGPALRYDPSYQVPVYGKIGCSSFSGEKHVKLFWRTLLEVTIEGSRLFAPFASTRSISGFCGAVHSILCCLFFTYIQPECAGSTLRVLPMIAVYFAVVRLLFCIADRYQESGIRCSILLILSAWCVSIYVYRDHCL